MMQKIQFDGLDALEICTPLIRAVLVYDIGPRIAFFGKRDGENLLYWQKDGIKRDNWRLYGGHRVWLTRPMADESEDTYIPDNDRCEVEFNDTRAVAVSPANGVNHLERGIEVEIVSEDTLRVRNFVRNNGNMIYSGGVWSPTCVVPDGRTLRIPLGQENVTWDVVRIVIPRIFAGNQTTLQDDQAEFVNNDLIITPKGRVIKRCCSAPQGRVQLICDDFMFEKHSPYQKLNRYPFEGCNVACFVGQNNFMAELETFGGESEIVPGGIIENTEFWSIRPR